MTEVDFYVLNSESAEERDLFACRLAEKVFKQGRQLYLHVADETAARALDDLLWKFRPQSFLPHGLLGGEDDERIAIGWRDDPAQHRDVMINLDLAVPNFVGRFDRVAEVVVQAPAIRDQLRNSYKFYKDRGYPLKTNNL